MYDYKIKLLYHKRNSLIHKQYCFWCPCDRRLTNMDTCAPHVMRQMDNVLKAFSKLVLVHQVRQLMWVKVKSDVHMFQCRCLGINLWSTSGCRRNGVLQAKLAWCCLLNIVCSGIFNIFCQISLKGGKYPLNLDLNKTFPCRQSGLQVEQLVGYDIVHI